MVKWNNFHLFSSKSSISQVKNSQKITKKYSKLKASSQSLIWGSLKKCLERKSVKKQWLIKFAVAAEPNRKEVCCFVFCIEIPSTSRSKSFENPGKFLVKLRRKKSRKTFAKYGEKFLVKRTPKKEKLYDLSLLRPKKVFVWVKLVWSVIVKKNV